MASGSSRVPHFTQALEPIFNQFAVIVVRPWGEFPCAFFSRFEQFCDQDVDDHHVPFGSGTVVHVKVQIVRIWTVAHPISVVMDIIFFSRFMVFEVLVVKDFERIPDQLSDVSLQKS